MGGGHLYKINILWKCDSFWSRLFKPCLPSWLVHSYLWWAEYESEILPFTSIRYAFCIRSYETERIYAVQINFGENEMFYLAWHPQMYRFTVSISATHELVLSVKKGLVGLNLQGNPEWIHKAHYPQTNSANWEAAAAHITYLVQLLSLPLKDR